MRPRSFSRPGLALVALPCILCSALAAENSTNTTTTFATAITDEPAVAAAIDNAIHGDADAILSLPKKIGGSVTLAAADVDVEGGAEVEANQNTTPKDFENRRSYTMIGMLEEGAAKFHAQYEITDDMAEQICNHYYFDFNRANLMQSGVVAEYFWWTQRNKENILANGEVREFGRTFLQDRNYRCGIHEDCAMPSCSAIVKRYRGDYEEARLVYFAQSMINTVNRDFRVKMGAMLEASVATGHRSALLESVFTQRANPEAIMLCQLFHNIIGFVKGLTIEMYERFAADKLGVDTKGFWQYIELAIKPGHLTEEQSAKWSNSFSKWVQGIEEAYSKTKQLYYGVLEPLHKKRPTEGMCAPFGGDYHPDDWATWTNALYSFSKIALRLRDDILDEAEKINQGSYELSPGQEMEGSRMAAYMLTAIANFEKVEADIANAKSLYHDIHRMFENEIVQGYLINFNTYIKCQKGQFADNYCPTLNGTLKKIDRSRSCPEPGVICQISSLSSSQKPWEVEMHGINKLRSIDQDIEQILHFNYFREKANMERGDNPSLSIIDTVAGQHRNTNLTIPTCISEYIALGDFTHRSKVFCHRQYCQRIPMTCGSWKGERFEIFKHETLDMGYGSSSEIDRWDYMKRLFPHEMNTFFKHSPAAQFLTECTHDTHFPMHKEKGKWAQCRGDCFNPMMGGRSEHCTTIAKELAPFSDQDSANEHFCLASPTATAYMQMEVNYVDSVLPRYISKKRACRKFLEKKYGIKGRAMNKKWPHLKVGHNGGATKYPYPKTVEAEGKVELDNGPSVAMVADGLAPMEEQLDFANVALKGKVFSEAEEAGIDWDDENAEWPEEMAQKEKLEEEQKKAEELSE